MANDRQLWFFRFFIYRMGESAALVCMEMRTRAASYAARPQRIKAYLQSNMSCEDTSNLWNAHTGYIASSFYTGTRGMVAFNHLCLSKLWCKEKTTCETTGTVLHRGDFANQQRKVCRSPCFKEDCLSSNFNFFDNLPHIEQTPPSPDSDSSVWTTD